MTTIFDDTPKYPGLQGDLARVTSIEDRVLIRAVDTMAEEGVTIAMSPEQARRLAEAIKDAAAEAEGGEARLGWRCIGTAPKDGTAILATGVNFGLPGRGRHYALARWDRCEHPSPDDWSGWYEPDGDGGPYYWLTHWMPLPEAPQ